MRILSITLLLALTMGCATEDPLVDASGVFEATEILVSAEANGKILQMDVTEGDNISEGTVTTYIDSMQFVLNREQLIANKDAILSGLPNIDVQIEALKQDIKRMKKEKSRVEKLLEGDVATQKQLDDINAQIALLEARLSSQQSMLETTTRSIYAQSKTIDSQIAILEDQLSKCKVKNPISGTVLSSYARTGEVTAMGKPLYRIADLEQMNLRAYVTGEQLSQIQLGQAVEVLAEIGAEGRKPYQGTIQWISEKSEFTPKTIQTQDERANLVYAVKVRVKNDGQLKIGMYGGIKLSGS